MKKSIIWIYYAIAAFFFYGFAVHPSLRQDIFIYSYSYASLLFALIIILGVTPFIFKWLHKKMDTQGLVFTLVPTTLLLSLIYLTVHFFHYGQQQNDFDPFLQIAPNKFEITAEKDSNTIRILCLGGGTTNNDRLEEHQNYPHQLEILLQKEHPNKNVQVINAGMGWYTTRHSLINYNHYYKGKQFDAVIIMHAINDLVRSFSPHEYAIGAYQSDYSHFYGPSINGAKAPSLEHQIAYFFQHNWMDDKRVKKRDLDFSSYLSFEDFGRYYKLLNESIESDGIPVIMVEQAHLYKKKNSNKEKQRMWMGLHYCLQDKVYPTYSSLYEAMTMYNMKASTLHNDSTIFFSINTIKKDLVNFMDEVNFNENGAMILANKLNDFIRVKNILKY